MSVDRVLEFNQPAALAATAQAAPHSIAEPLTVGMPLLPLGAMLLAGSIGTSALAQPSPDAVSTLPAVTVRDAAASDGSTHSKTQLRATRTDIGKGNQALRDIPQSVTVMTEKLMQHPKLEDLREVLASSRKRALMRRRSPTRW